MDYDNASAIDDSGPALSLRGLRLATSVLDLQQGDQSIAGGEVCSTGPRSGHWTVSSGANGSAIDDICPTVHRFRPCGLDTSLETAFQKQGAPQPVATGTLKKLQQAILVEHRERTHRHIVENENPRHAEPNYSSATVFEPEKASSTSSSRHLVVPSINGRRGITIVGKEGQKIVVCQPGRVRRPRVENESPIIENHDETEAQSTHMQRSASKSSSVTSASRISSRLRTVQILGRNGERAWATLPQVQKISTLASSDRTRTNSFPNNEIQRQLQEARTVRAAVQMRKQREVGGWTQDHESLMQTNHKIPRGTKPTNQLQSLKVTGALPYEQRAMAMTNGGVSPLSKRGSLHGSFPAALPLTKSKNKSINAIGRSFSDVINEVDGELNVCSTVASTSDSTTQKTSDESSNLTQKSPSSRSSRTSTLTSSVQSVEKLQSSTASNHSRQKLAPTETKSFISTTRNQSHRPRLGLESNIVSKTSTDSRKCIRMLPKSARESNRTKSPGHTSDNSPKLSPSFGPPHTTKSGDTKAINSEGPEILRSSSTFEHRFDEDQRRTSSQQSTYEPRSERHRPSPTIFAGHGWISPHPLSVTSSAWQDPPQSAITLPADYPSRSNKGKLSYEEWKKGQWSENKPPSDNTGSVISANGNPSARSDRYEDVDNLGDCGFERGEHTNGSKKTRYRLPSVATIRDSDRQSSKRVKSHGNRNTTTPDMANQSWYRQDGRTVRRREPGAHMDDSPSRTSNKATLDDNGRSNHSDAHQNVEDTGTGVRVREWDSGTGALSTPLQNGISPITREKPRQLLMPWD